MLSWVASSAAGHAGEAREKRKHAPVWASAPTKIAALGDAGVGRFKGLGRSYPANPSATRKRRRPSEAGGAWHQFDSRLSFRRHQLRLARSALRVADGQRFMRLLCRSSGRVVGNENTYESVLLPLEQRVSTTRDSEPRRHLARPNRTPAQTADHIGGPTTCGGLDPAQIWSSTVRTGVTVRVELTNSVSVAPAGCPHRR